MRSLLLASAAVLLTTGIACAQMSSSSPAPTGSAGEPMAQSGAPAGKTAPSPSTAGSNTMSSNSSATPSYNGQDSITNGESGSTKTGPLGQKASASGNSMSNTHHWSYGAMPENADARTYLRIARMDIQHHNRGGADEALNRAETRVLTRSVPVSGAMTDDSPTITAIENARQALDAGNYHEAAMDTDMAMHHHMSSGMGMGSDVTDTDSSSSSSSVTNEPSPRAQQNGNNPNAATTIPGDGTSSPGMSAGASSGAQQ